MGESWVVKGFEGRAATEASVCSRGQQCHCRNEISLESSFNDRHVSFVTMMGPSSCLVEIYPSVG